MATLCRVFYVFLWNKPRLLDLLRSFFDLMLLLSSLYLALWILQRNRCQSEFGGLPATRNLPAVAGHAHAFALGGTVEPSALFEVFLASDTLGIAEAGLGERIDVSPTCFLVSPVSAFSNIGCYLLPAISKQRSPSALSCSMPQPFMWLTPSS